MIGRILAALIIVMFAVYLVAAIAGGVWLIAALMNS